MGKPILFNTEEVQAILRGRKISTRRIITPQPKLFYVNGQQRSITNPDQIEFKVMEDSGRDCFMVPPYQIEDVLYVRETFANTWTPDGEEGFVYKADGEPPIFPYWGNVNQCKDEVWIPSIHMPKKAARIFLKVTDIEVQKLQDIAEEEALAEGIRSYSKDDRVYKYAISDDWWMDYCNKHKRPGTWWQRMPETAKEAFKYLWNSYYKWPKCWEFNPYVWIIRFKKINNYKIK